MSTPQQAELSETSLAWIALNLTPGIGPAKAHHLAAAFGTPEAVFTASPTELAEVPGIGESLAQRLAALAWRASAERELDRCRRIRGRVVTLAEADYPALLRTIDCPPPVLYLRGEVTPADAEALAVVGSRHPTQYGLLAAKRLVGDLVLAGFTIVSGLARGIDTAAHHAALESGGRTLAVLAHGLDRVYPAENEELLARITSAGAALSEFPLGMTPLKENFPRRNRVISGLARGVLVVEAGQDSGALITANWAVDQGREVFAVPGPFDSRLSQGTHALIQAGAKLTMGLPDLLAELSGSGRASAGSTPAPSEPLTPGQTRIREALTGSGGCHVDQLAAVCGLSIPGLLAELTGLELRGLVQVAPGPVYHWSGW